MGSERHSWQVRAAYREEWQDAMALVWKTFLKYESEDYTQEGIQHFQDFITDSTLYRMFLTGSYEMIVAVENKKIIGVITVRSGGHVSLLFVDEAYHKRGVGKSLVQYLCNYLLTEAGISRITVNASPYGVGFYHKMGFCDTGLERWQNGILYTPMEFVL